MVDRELITEREDKRDREQREWQEGQGRSRLRWEIIVFGVIVTIVLAASQIVAAFIARDSVVVEPSQVQPPNVIVEPPNVVVEPQIIIDDSILPVPDPQGGQPPESP